MDGALLVCGCAYGFVCSRCAGTPADEDYIEHLPEPPEPVYAEGDGGE